MPDAEPQITVLDNGLRIVTDAMPHARSVTAGVWVGVGGRDEDPRVAGASHFLEHLFFKGTAARSARDIAESVDRVGGDLNAFTAREHTAFHTRLPASEWRMGVELLGDLLTAPALRPSEIDAEREVILEELWAALDTPEDRVHSAAIEALFPDHPLGREVLGDEDTVRAMTRDDIAAFFDQHYRPGGLVVAAAGRLDHEEFCEAVAAALGGGPSVASQPAPLRTPPGTDVGPDVTIERDGEQTHLVQVWRGLPIDHDDRYALHVANQVLGAGSASRLFQSVREDRGLAYTVYSWISSYSDSGVLGVYAGTAPSRTAELRDVLDAELAAIVADGVTEDEVDVARGYLAGSTELGLEDSGSRMGRIGRMMLSTGRLTSIDEQLDRIRAVTVSDVDRVLRDLLVGSPTTALVGPTGS